MVKTGRYWGDQVGDVLSQGPFHGEADRTCWQRECGMGEKRVQVGSKVLAWATKRRHARVLSCVQLVCNPIDCSPTASSCPWSFPGRSTGVQLLLGCHFLLQSKEQGCYLLRWRKSVGRAGLREKLDSNFGGKNYSWSLNDRVWTA